MPSETSAVEMSTRAAALRWLAIRLETSVPASLATRAGEQTWIGPTADRCRADVVAQIGTVATSAADLRARARALEAAAAIAATMPTAGPF